MGVCLHGQVGFDEASFVSTRLIKIRWPKKPKTILSSDGLGHKYAKEGKFDY